MFCPEILPFGDIYNQRKVKKLYYTKAKEKKIFFTAQDHFHYNFNRIYYPMSCKMMNNPELLELLWGTIHLES
jgi:hypothetical protein